MKNLSIDQKIAIGVLIVAILWLIIGPALLVLPSTLFDFRETGQIGDTIGGITAPIVGLASAILVYLSFSAQINANKITILANQIAQQEANFKYIIEEFEKVKKSFKNITYSPVSEDSIISKPYRGHLAMLLLTQDVVDKPTLIDSGSLYISEILTKIEYIYRSYSVFISEVNSVNLSEEQKRIVQIKIWLYHEENINDYFKQVKIWNFKKPVGDEYEKTHKDKLLKAYNFKILTLTIDSEITPFKNSFKDK